MIHNIAPTQITLHRRHLSHNMLCPICQEADETIMHIIQCNDSDGKLQQNFCTLLNKKLKTKTDAHQVIIKDIYNLIIDKPTGPVQSLQWETQQYLGWDCCIRGFLSTEWLEIPRLMNLEKPEVETVGWIIVTLWKTWNEAWKARNRRFKEEDRYTAQNAKMQRTIDVNIIYHRREYLPDKLNGQLKLNVEEHLSQSDASIDEWLLMFRSIIHQNVIKKNKRAWKEAENII
jgi:hypothetical protein